MTDDVVDNRLWALLRERFNPRPPHTAPDTDVAIVRRRRVLELALRTARASVSHRPPRRSA